MKMEMLADTGTRSLSLVEPYIDSLTIKVTFQNRSTALQKRHDLARFPFRQIFQRHDVPVGAHHEMPVIIRKLIHDDETGRSSMQHQPLGIFFSSPGQTEDALIGLGAKDIVNAPRCPQLFHDEWTIHTPTGRGKL